MRARLQGSGTLTIICPVYTFFIADPEPASILSQYTSVLANSYAEKSPALAAPALRSEKASDRAEGLDFSRLFTSPAEESLDNDNRMVFAV